ncbi:hypothetical protein PR003_g26961 [Phytophthora rubi]|uniref:Serine aminopeptidase S33 domain-containing protein n=1 Tax=Phytophthora rubi TaxID=129364 RepID=A0A6A3JPJ1_9STRA|nr:hypothetical protein PR001_g25794 [Phytophthora rubi]KAE8995368.1 hypothetical protein PR002_g19639 [Phytophthora rubi]KAE9284039.1 hypothetical protein PR003_g26961 [Phytophthora rubi]
MNRLTRKKRVEQLASDFCKLRVLFLTGSEDHITDQGVIQQFFSHLANAVKEREVFDGVLHCVFTSRGGGTRAALAASVTASSLVGPLTRCYLPTFLAT